MNEHEPNVWHDENFGKPELEMMNNFYMHMPGKFYRPEANRSTRQLLDEYPYLFKQSEDDWPVNENEREGLSTLKIKMVIQESIDRFLKQNGRIAGWWEDHWHDYPNRMNEAMRQVIGNQIIRKVYVAMREQGFWQADLVS